MGAIKKVHPMSLSHNEEDGRDASSLLNMAQPCSSSSLPNSTHIESLLDTLISSYSSQFIKMNGNVNIELDNMAKMIDICTSINERISKGRVYQRLLASAVLRCLSFDRVGSPDKMEKTLQTLEEASKYSVAHKGKCQQWGVFMKSSQQSNAQELIEQTLVALKALDKSLSLKVEGISSKLTLKSLFKKALKTKKDNTFCMAELNRAVHLVKNERNGEGFAGKLQRVSLDLERALNKVESKLAVFKALLVKSQVSLLDLVSYSL